MIIPRHKVQVLNETPAVKKSEIRIEIVNIEANCNWEKAKAFVSLTISGYAAGEKG